MSTFVKELRKKDWDVAQIYAKGIPPITLEKTTTWVVEEDAIVVTPEPHIHDVGGDRFVKATKKVVHIDEIVVIDFFIEVKPPKVVVPENSGLVSPTGMPISGKDLQI